MVISVNSQLGLRFKDNNVKHDFLTLMKEYIEKELGLTESVINKLFEISKNHVGEDGTVSLNNLSQEEHDYVFDSKDNLVNLTEQAKVREKITMAVGEVDMLEDEDSRYYFICDSVYKCAELIKIKQWFSGRTLKDIRFGKYTYLMGKNVMVRFLVGLNVIKGWYYDCEKRVVFEWGVEMDNGDYYFSHNRSDEFTTVMRILTFVELGDIEVKMLEAGRNNGLAKKDGKITNTTQNTVYVVDSTWNQIIIRTDGFAVRGHFRLQPCGDGMRDRKLIWIDAFEKHGYKRTPRASIVRD